MATIINNPPEVHRNEDGTGVGMIVGILLVIILGILFFFYGLPMIQKTNSTPERTTQNIEVNVPAPIVDTATP